MKLIITGLFILTTSLCYGQLTKVTRVIDGDTFETEHGDKVRLIGINAPEISDVYGDEAKQHLTNLIDGKTVDLLSDNDSNDRDRYSRLLRYVILNGIDINKEMIADGFAFAYLKYHFSKEDDYRQTQLTALKNNMGIWGDGTKNKNVEQGKTNENLLVSLSPKAYFISALIFILFCFGVYFYFKK